MTASLKDKLANRRDWSKWVGRTKVLDDLISPEHTEPSHIEKERLLRLQKAMGLTHEDLELILHPMGEDGKEAIGSMGDDTPARDPFRSVSRPASLLPSELLSGDQPADRFPS